MAEQQFRDGSQFPATDWSRVRRAAGPDADVSREALDALLRNYHPALCRHVGLKFHVPHERAEDLVQEFVVQRILSTNLLSRADPAKGKFRTFVLTALDRFVIDEFRKANRKPPRSALDPNSLAQPNRLVFDCVWAQSVIVNALQRMRLECQRKGRFDAWRIFFKRLVEPLVQPDKPPSMDELARQCGLDSAKKASNLFVNAKRRFHSHLLDVVREYVPDSDAGDAELLALCRILADNHVARTSNSFDAHSSIMDSDLWSTVDNAENASLRQLLDSAVIRSAAGANPDECLDDECRRSAQSLFADCRGKFEIPSGDHTHLLDGVTVEELLTSSTTERDVLIVVKRFYRFRSRQALSKNQTRVAKVMYLAAIASAFLTHDKLLSKRPQAEILVGWGRILQYPWLCDSIRSIVQRACSRLEAVDSE